MCGRMFELRFPAKNLLFNVRQLNSPSRVNKIHTKSYQLIEVYESFRFKGKINIKINTVNW